MILTKEVEVCIVPSNIKYYRNLCIDANMMKKIVIPIEILQKQSNIKIDVCCDRCNIHRKIKYQAYILNIGRSLNGETYMCDKCSHEKIKITNKEKYGVDYFSQTTDFTNSIKKTSIEKFGVEHYSKTKEYIESRDKTNLEKFGVKNPFELIDMIKESMIGKYGVDHPSKICNMQTQIQSKRRKTKEETGNWIKVENLSEWKIYKNKVNSLTSKLRKYIFENWDGYDFYDGGYIKENKKLHFNVDIYPTIDHKISIYEGFVSNIDPSEIASLDNLCITKRRTNISKGKKSYRP